MELNRFKQLLESTMGNSKPLINEVEDDMDELIDVNVEVENPECWENITSSDGKRKKRRRGSSSCSHKYKTKSKTSHYGNNWH